MSISSKGSFSTFSLMPVVIMATFRSRSVDTLEKATLKIPDPKISWKINMDVKLTLPI